MGLDLSETISPGKRNEGPAARRYEGIIFYRKRTHFLCYLLGMEKSLKSFELVIMELQVKELQKADSKACCLLDDLIMRSSSWKVNTVLYMGHLKLHEVDTAITTN